MGPPWGAASGPTRHLLQHFPRSPPSLPPVAPASRSGSGTLCSPQRFPNLRTLQPLIGSPQASCHVPGTDTCGHATCGCPAPKHTDWGPAARSGVCARGLPAEMFRRQVAPQGLRPAVTPQVPGAKPRVLGCRPQKPALHFQPSPPAGAVSGGTAGRHCAQEPGCPRVYAAQVTPSPPAAHLLCPLGRGEGSGHGRGAPR